MKRAPRTDIGDVEPAAQKVQNGTRGDKVVQVKRRQLFVNVRLALLGDVQ
jgi:hypothetical protein